MNKLFPIFLLLTVTGCFTSCHEKKKTDVIITHKPEKPRPRKPLSMSSYEQVRNVEWLGTTYKIVVKRTVDSTLPVLVQDDKSKYFDNKIIVRVLRKDGSVFFERAFTKNDFASYIDENTKRTGALLGIVYMDTTETALVFAASVGSPDITSDEYVPMKLSISRMGQVTVCKDSQLDTDGEDEKAPSINKDEADDGV